MVMKEKEGALAGATARRKNILILFAVVLFVLAVLVGTVLLLQDGLDSLATDEELIETYYENNKKFFKTPDFTLSAEDDTAYMQSYDRRIYYIDGSVKTELDAENLPLPAVSPLVAMISAITAGDSEAYNALFTASYLNEKGAQADFTAQKPYNIEVSYVGVSDGSHLFKLNYCLKDNDGTLRRDIISDMSRTLNITVTESGAEYYIASIGYHFVSR